MAYNTGGARVLMAQFIDDMVGGPVKASMSLHVEYHGVSKRETTTHQPYPLDTVHGVGCVQSLNHRLSRISSPPRTKVLARVEHSMLSGSIAQVDRGY